MQGGAVAEMNVIKHKYHLWMLGSHSVLAWQLSKQYLF